MYWTFVGPRGITCQVLVDDLRFDEVRIEFSRNKPTAQLANSSSSTRGTTTNWAKDSASMSRFPERRRTDAALSRLETTLAEFEAFWVRGGGAGAGSKGRGNNADLAGVHVIQRKVFHALSDLRLALSVLCERMEAAREQK